MKARKRRQINLLVWSVRSPGAWWGFRQWFEIVLFLSQWKKSKVKQHNWHDTWTVVYVPQRACTRVIEGSIQLDWRHRVYFLSLSLFCPLISALLAGLHHSSYLSSADRSLASWKALGCFSLNEYETWGIHFNNASCSPLSQRPLLTVERSVIWTAKQVQVHKQSLIILIYFCILSVFLVISLNLFFLNPPQKNMQKGFEINYFLPKMSLMRCLATECMLHAIHPTALATLLPILKQFTNPKRPRMETHAFFCILQWHTFKKVQ